LQAELAAIPGWFDAFPPDNGLTRKEQRAVETLRRFVADHGWAEFESSTKINGVQIGRFVGKWRTAHRRDQLDPRIVEQLEAIPGWSWESTHYQEYHNRVLALLREHMAAHGWKRVRRSVRYKGVNLHNWCACRRSDYCKGKLADWLRRELEAIPGWRWRSTDGGTESAGKPRT
jgi:hypothetical protein